VFGDGSSCQKGIPASADAEQKLHRVHRALRVLTRFNRTLVRAREESELLRATCEVLVEAGGYQLAWVGFAEQDPEKTVRPVAQAGYEEGYLETLHITWADTERGRGPTGTVIRAGKPVIARHIPTDPSFAPWRAEATKRGYASSIALPLVAEGQPLGALNIYAVEPDAFDAEEVQLLTELADDLTFGIVSLRTRTEHQRAAEIQQALYQAGSEIQGPGRLEDRLERLLRTARDPLDLDGIALFLPDHEGRWLQGMAGLGIDEASGPLRLPIGPDGGGVTKAYESREPVVWDGRASVPKELRLKPPYDQIAALRARIFAIVPLLVQGRAIGVLAAHRKHSRRAFAPATLELLQLFAGHAAPAIEQARLYEELRRAALYLEARVEDRTRELQDAMRRVEEASRYKSAFLATMSHELRTPLNSVIGFSELLLGEGVGPLTEKQARYLGHIDHAGKHLLQLIGDVLDLAKVEAGKFVLQPETLPVVATLEDILVIGRALAKKKAQTVEAELDADLPPLRADPLRFKQILFNLLSNAVKFTPDRGRIGLAASRSSADSSLLEIRVTDTGVGIKAEDLPRLFQEFVQLETTQAQKHEGTGLGLALTRRLVEMHGGRIRAESEGEGKGSTFTVLLPFGGPQEPPAP
jgi:signal transduction histidine kinase/putative methionine-R-sulfoxide reductase with GAF domain